MHQSKYYDRCLEDLPNGPHKKKNCKLVPKDPYTKDILDRAEHHCFLSFDMMNRSSACDETKGFVARRPGVIVTLKCLTQKNVLHNKQQI